MKQLKIYLAGIMLLFSLITFSQKKHLIPPPPPPEMEMNKNAEPPTSQNELMPPPSPPDIKGHPWTRNGQNVWVVTPPKPSKPTKPAIPPPPPPPTKRVVK